MVALWDAFYIDNKRFDLDTLRVPNRSPTPISKSNDFLRQSDDIWRARGPHFRAILKVPGARAGLKQTYFFSPLKLPPRFAFLSEAFSFGARYTVPLGLDHRRRTNLVPVRSRFVR